MKMRKSRFLVSASKNGRLGIRVHELEVPCDTHFIHRLGNASKKTSTAFMSLGICSEANSQILYTPFLFQCCTSPEGYHRHATKSTTTLFSPNIIVQMAPEFFSLR